MNKIKIWQLRQWKSSQPYIFEITEIDKKDKIAYCSNWIDYDLDDWFDIDFIINNSKKVWTRLL